MNPVNHSSDELWYCKSTQWWNKSKDKRWWRKRICNFITRCL